MGGAGRERRGGEAPRGGAVRAGAEVRVSVRGRAGAKSGGLSDSGDCKAASFQSQVHRRQKLQMPVSFSSLYAHMELKSRLYLTA